jgi:hypothetical protein
MRCAAYSLVRSVICSAVGRQGAAMAHMDHLERLIRLQDQRLLLVERQFEADLKMLVDDFDDERAEVTAAHRTETSELEAIHELVEAEEKDEEDQAEAELQTLKQECREKREDAIDDLRSVLDGRLEVIQVRAVRLVNLPAPSRSHRRDSFCGPGRVRKRSPRLPGANRQASQRLQALHAGAAWCWTGRYGRALTLYFAVPSAQINREREKDIERCVRGIERLQLQMLEIRNTMQLSARKFADQHKLLTGEKAAIQEQVAELREKVSG